MTDGGHLGFVNATRFSKNGDILYSASVEGDVFCWDIETLSLVNRLARHDGPVNDFVLAADAILSVGHDGLLVISDLDGQVSVSDRYQSPLHAIDARDRTVMFGGSDNRVYFREGDDTIVLGQHDDAIECVLLESDIGFSGSRDTSIRVWDLTRSCQAGVLQGHQDWVTRITRISDTTVLSVGEDGLIIAWDVQNLEEVWRINIGLPIWGLAVDDRAAYIGKASGSIVVDLEQQTYDQFEGLDGFAARAISVHDGLIAFGHDGGGIDLVRGTSLVGRIPGRFRGTLCAAFHDRGAISGDQDGNVSFISPEGATVKNQAHERMAYCAVSLSNSLAAVGAFDGYVSIWDTRQQSLVRKLHTGGHTFSVSTNADKSRLLTAGEDQWQLWHTKSWEVKKQQTGIGSGIHTLASLSQDGRTIITVGEDARLRIWFDGAEARQFKLPFQDAASIAMAPNTDWAYIAFNDGVVGKIELTSGDYYELHRLHDCWVRQLVVSSDGRSLASCSQNGIAILHDLTTGETIRAGRPPIAAIGFSSEDTLSLFTCDGNIETTTLPQ